VGRVANIFANSVWTFLAFFISFRLIPSGGDGAGFQQPIDPFSLTISLALLLIGLYTMIVKTDIISQVIGLLVIEHGMFLAAIKVITIPGLTIIFVVSMVTYIFITLLILGYLLPHLREAFNSIEIDKINQLKG
jgi:hydrogenase-4 membrane subunit HyfE